MTKVFWFSRHTMTEDQKKALENKLGQVEVMQVNGSPANVHVPFEGEVNGIPTNCRPIKDLVKDFDVIAIVAPVGLQQQFLSICNEKPVIMAKSNRVLVPQPDGNEPKAIFQFVKWEQLEKIDIVMEDFA